jgi:hypothetical protein
MPRGTLLRPQFWVFGTLHPASKDAATLRLIRFQFQPFGTVLLSPLRPISKSTLRLAFTAPPPSLGSLAFLQNLCTAGKYSASGDGDSGCTTCPSSTPYSRVGSTSLSACVACPSGSCNGTYGAVMASPCIDSSWTVWYDRTGQEGFHSCLKVYPTTLSWTAASSACRAVASDVHLLTTASEVGVKVAPCRWNFNSIIATC